MFNGSFFKKQSILSDDDINCLKAYNAEIERGISPQTAYYRTMQNASDAAVNMAASAGKATVNIGAIPKVSKAATLGLKALSVAGNMLLSMGISMAISAAIKGLDYLIHRSEKIIEKGEEAREVIQGIRDDFDNLVKSTNDSKQRYAELAQGVNQLTGKNISLSNEDYEEFLSLSNQLAEIFPTLSRNYDDNGNAIIQLSGDVDTIVGSLNNLIETERGLTNRQIVNNLPTTFDGVVEKSNSYESELEELESNREALLQGLEELTSESLSQKFQTGLNDKYFEISSRGVEEYSRLLEDYTQLLEDANLRYTPSYFEPTWNGEYDNEGKQVLTYKAAFYIDSSDEDIEKAKAGIDIQAKELAKQYEGSISDLNEKIKITNEKNKANWYSLSSAIFAWLSTDDSFMVMDDTMQATVQNIVNSLDWAELDFSSWGDAKQYIQDNILELFNTADGKSVLADVQVMFGIQTKFNNNEIPVKDYQEKVNALLDAIKALPPETQKAIKLLFGIETDENGKSTSDVDTMIANVKKKFDGKFEKEIGELTFGELEILSNMDISPNGIESWDEVKKILAESAKTADKATASLSDLEKVSDNIGKLSTAYKELSDNGYITIKTINELKTATGLSGDEWAEYENKLLNCLQKKDCNILIFLTRYDIMSEI